MMMTSTLWVGLSLAMIANGSPLTAVAPLLVWVGWRRWEWSKGWGKKGVKA